MTGGDPCRRSAKAADSTPGGAALRPARSALARGSLRRGRRGLPGRTHRLGRVRDDWPRSWATGLSGSPRGTASRLALRRGSGLSRGAVPAKARPASGEEARIRRLPRGTRSVRGDLGDQRPTLGCVARALRGDLAALRLRSSPTLECEAAALQRACSSVSSTSAKSCSSIVSHELRTPVTVISGYNRSCCSRSEEAGPQRRAAALPRGERAQSCRAPGRVHRKAC